MPLVSVVLKATARKRRKRGWPPDLGLDYLLTWVQCSIGGGCVRVAPQRKGFLGEQFVHLWVGQKEVDRSLVFIAQSTTKVISGQNLFENQYLI